MLQDFTPIGRLDKAAPPPALEVAAEVPSFEVPSFEAPAPGGDSGKKEKEPFEAPDFEIPVF